MKMKKKVMILTLSAMLGGAFIHDSASASAPANSNSVKVVKGDSLWKLSKEYHTDVATLKKMNHLSSDKIYVGQVLKVGQTSSVKTTPVTTAKQTTNSTAKAEVKGVSVSNNQRTDLANYAKKYVGTPYKWGGTTPAGFDCSGFMYYTLKSESLVSSRLSVDGYWSQAKKVKSPVSGDLVFFQNTYKSGPSHVGIYLGNGEFVHASSDGVVIDSIDSSYWKKHFLGYGTMF